MSKNRNQQQRHALDCTKGGNAILTPESTECSAAQADATFEAIAATNKPGPREFFKPPVFDNPYGIAPGTINHDHRLQLAGKAMAALIAKHDGSGQLDHDHIADEAWLMADSMLRSGGYKCG